MIAQQAVAAALVCSNWAPSVPPMKSVRFPHDHISYGTTGTSASHNLHFICDLVLRSSFVVAAGNRRLLKLLRPKSSILIEENCLLSCPSYYLEHANSWGPQSCKNVNSSCVAKRCNTFTKQLHSVCTV